MGAKYQSQVAIGIPGGVLDEPHELTPEADVKSVGAKASVEITDPSIKVQAKPTIALLLEVVGQKPRDLASLEPSHEPINLGAGEVIAPLDEANRPVPNPMRVPHPSANYSAHAHPPNRLPPDRQATQPPSSSMLHILTQSTPVASQFTWRVMLAKVLVWGTAWAFLT